MTKEEAREMLTNTKVYVNGKSKEIQEKLFEIGFKWISTKKSSLLNLDIPFLYLNEDIWSGYSMQDFNKSNFKEVPAEDILNIKLDEEFVPKHGDIIFATDKYGFFWVSIFNKIEDNYIYTYVDLTLNDKTIFDLPSHIFSSIEFIHNLRLATEKEKSILFSALKEKGLVWNEKAKEIETIKQSNKVHEFKPFDKVLGRDTEEDEWNLDLFGNFSTRKNIYSWFGGYWKICK